MVYTCTYILMYKHVCTFFRRVCTCLYKYIRVLTYINMYISCTHMYIHVCYLFLVYIHVSFQGMYSWCAVYRWLHTFHEMYRHSWMVYIHWCMLLGLAFSFALLACLQAGSGCCQVSRLFKFKHTCLISIILKSSYHLVTPPFLLAWGLIQQQQEQLQAPPHRRESSSCPACSSCRVCGRRCGGAASSLGVVPASFWSSNWRLTILVLGQPLAP